METPDTLPPRTEVNFGIAEGFKFAIGFYVGTAVMVVLTMLAFGTFFAGLASEVLRSAIQ